MGSVKRSYPLGRVFKVLDPPQPPGLFHSQTNHHFLGVVPLCLPSSSTILYVFQTSGRALLAPPLQENETALPQPPLKRGEKESQSLNTTVSSLIAEAEIKCTINKFLASFTCNTLEI